MIQSLRLVKYLPLFFRKNWDHPIYVTVYITDRCNLACRHCFYREELNKNNELSLADAKKLARSLNPCLFIAFTGGEPFLRADLTDLVSLFLAHSNVEIVGIPTNGTLPQKIERDVRTLLEVTNRLVNITVSVDGLEEQHDEIRGVSGTFKKCMVSLGLLCALKKKYTNLNVGIISTIQTFNQRSLKQLFDFTNSHYDINHFQLNFLRGNPGGSAIDDDTLNIYQKLSLYIYTELRRKGRFYNMTFGTFYHRVNYLYKQLLIKTIKEKRFITPCYAGSLNGVVYADMDVYPCEMLREARLGNLKDGDFNIKEIWKSSKTFKRRDSIRKSKCFCTFECQLTTNVLFNPKYFIPAMGLTSLARNRKISLDTCSIGY